MTTVALTDHEKRRIRFHCRRGMLELDVQLRPYIDAVAEQLADDEWRDLAHLLEQPDPDIFNWLMGHETAGDDICARALARVRSFHQR